MSDERFSPEALKQMRKNGESKPEDTSWGDWMLDTDPNKPLNPRQEELCHLAALGTRNQTIAEKVGYFPGNISVLLSNVRIKARIAEIRKEYLDQSIEQRIKTIGPLAMDKFQEVLEDPNAKETTKLTAALWALEKITGKPLQQHKVEGNLLGDLLDRLDLAKEAQSGQGASSRNGIDEELPLIDVTPKRGAYDSFFDQNLPEGPKPGEHKGEQDGQEDKE